MPKDDGLVKPVDFAKEKGIRPQLIFSWIRSKTVPVAKTNAKGRQWQVKRSDLEARYQAYVQAAEERLESAKQYMA